MLRITIQKDVNLITLKLEGKLARVWVDELERAWLAEADRTKSMKVDMSGVTFVDEEGKKLLGWIFEQGTVLHATDCMNRSIIEAIRRRHHRSTVDGVLKSLLTKVIAATIVVCSATVGVRGQQPGPTRLTLREAVQTALKQNPQVLLANLNVATSQQDSLEARSALLPQAGIEVFEERERFNLAAFIGTNFPGFSHHAGPFSVFQAGGSVKMPVFDLTLWRRWQASRQGIRGSEAQESTVREQIVLLIVSQYLGSLRASADVKAAHSRVELAQALYDQASDLQKHGVGTGLDTLRANVQLQNETQRLIAAETELKTSHYGLVRLLNLEPHQAVELADEMSFFQTPELSVNQSLENAWQSRPEMKALNAREGALQLSRQAASASRFPTISGSLAWSEQGLTPGSSIPAYQYQATLDVPVYTGGRIKAEITKADLELRKVAQDRMELTNQIALQVKSAIALLESARHEVDVANQGVKLAQEEVTQARDRFQAGVANNIEVVTAQDELARANDNQIAALYRYNQSRADLAQAVGQIEQLYSK
jgi:outer membrane protein